MTEHTPSTTDIRIRYEWYREQEHQRGADGVTPVTPGEFERWLAAEVAAAKAEALRDAAQMAPFPIDPYGGFDGASLSAARTQITHWLQDRADQIEDTP